jgi:two-component system, cell cycle response regulator
VKAEKKKILVVDDSPTIRRIIRDELEDGGYIVEEAVDGFDALNRIPLFIPDLITLDVDMPELDGFETCRRIKDTFGQKGKAAGPDPVPVVFVTSSDTLEARQQGFAVGATDFITKPFLEGKLLESLDKILRQGGAMNGLTLLVVDECTLTRGVIRENLKREGATVMEAGDGDAALKIMAGTAVHFDLVITALVLPGMDGRQLCHKIRHELGLIEIPIVFLITEADQSQLLKVFAGGASDYLARPFFKEELIARINVHVEKARLVDRLKKNVDDVMRAEEEKMRRQKLQGVLEMAGAVCHELNQPMQSIAGYAELLMMDIDPSHPAYKQVNDIANQVYRMAQITKNLMNITRYETKEYIMGRKIVDIEKASNRESDPK